jgi:hypothetical protein
MILQEGVSMKTYSNHASLYGGVLYQEDTATSTQCDFNSQHEKFILHKLPPCSLTLALNRDGFNYSINAAINSHNDSSEVGGSFMYSGLLDRCQINPKSYDVIPLRDINVERLAISSQPYLMCFITSEDAPECTAPEIHTVYRGQTFSVYLYAADQMKSKTSETARLKLGQNSQVLSSDHLNVSYNLYSTASSEKLILYPDGPCRDTGLARVVVDVIFLPCPDGFKPSGEECMCEERLQAYGASCNIDADASISRGLDSGLWLSALYYNNTYQGLSLFGACPVEYCKMENISFVLDNPDIQCANNRSGVVCGACASNYSLMLGSSRCKECSNTYLTLLLPFATAGIALVVFLSVLRLTVATGTINSVILYAYVLQVNKEIFFPPNTVNILTVFIAWMNLDLGFETCFYNGLTAYVETWLQFAFPVFVWIIITTIIVASKYSLTVSKLIGHNPVSVLATLLLLSYAKILKIIIDVYSFANIDLPEGKEVMKWLKDANVEYLKAKHLFLAVFTSLILVFLFLPYTLLLLLGYKFYRFSGGRYCGWLNRLKPFLDSYYAPYNRHTWFLVASSLCSLWDILSWSNQQESSSHHHYLHSHTSLFPRKCTTSFITNRNGGIC